jgi:uroporphyrinogen decarboxylase
MTEKLFLQTLHGKLSERVPFWFMRQAGRYLPEYRKVREESKHFLTMCYTPEIATEITLQPIRRFGMDAAIIFSDILVIPHALGLALDFRQGEGPVLETVKDNSDLAKLDRSRIHSHLAPVYEVLSSVAKELPENTALIGFAGAPWTVASYMIEGGTSKNFTTLKRVSYQNPDFLARLIDLLVEVTADYLIAQVKAGAEALQLFDSWAGAVSASDYRRWVVEPARKIYQKVKAACPQVPMIGFPKGSGVQYGYYSGQTGMDCVGFDMQMPAEWVRKQLDATPCVQGNLDPILLAYDGPRALKEADHLLTVFRDRPYVFNLGHGMIPETPVEHVEALCHHLRNYRRKMAA